MISAYHSVGGTMSLSLAPLPPCVTGKRSRGTGSLGSPWPLDTRVRARDLGASRRSPRDLTCTKIKLLDVGDICNADDDLQLTRLMLLLLLLPLLLLLLPAEAAVAGAFSSNSIHSPAGGQLIGQPAGQDRTADGVARHLDSCHHRGSG